MRFEVTQNQFYDPKFNSITTIILPGEYSTTSKEKHMLVTILGSCVAACIRDPIAKIGGINHFLLAKPNHNSSPISNRYGCYAMECLINEILKNGGQKERLEIKIFGGADLIQSRLKIGSQNINFIRNYLKTEGFRVTAEDLGGNRPRRIHYWPWDGRAMRQIISPHEEGNIIENETTYHKRLIQEKRDGDIEFF